MAEVPDVLLIRLQPAFWRARSATTMAIAGNDARPPADMHLAGRPGFAAADE
jgi:hypothetical protein